MEEQWGPEAAIVRFRKMAHWYLKSMRVRPAMRHHLQKARTREQFNEALAVIIEAGPVGGDRTGLLPDMHVPVPSGPVERW